MSALGRNTVHAPAARVAAAAGGAMLIGVGAMAVGSMLEAWGAVGAAHRALEQIGPMVQGDGSPVSRGGFDRSAAVISVVCGGGLIAAAVYGGRVVWLMMEDRRPETERA